MLTVYFIIMVAHMMLTFPIALVELLNDRTGFEELPTWVVTVIVFISVAFMSVLWPLSLFNFLRKLMRGYYT